MCGICGFIGSDGSLDVLHAMCNVIAHRGPDDNGYFWEAGQAALGMRRLSIIDVEGGQQPIYNENHDLLIVFNGEIYNFVQLRADLTACGHRFVTRTDTEVILHGYEEYGARVFEKLDGMFGIALLDLKHRCLTLARDRMGIKPIYYAWVNGNFIFGSEIKSIVLFPGFEPRIDRVALDGYLTYQYVPAPLTLLKGVRKLRAGHSLVVELETRDMTEKPFWRFEFEPPDTNRSETEWIEALKETLDAAVRSHLVSDVPIGAFLSGGVDSSTIVALMAHTMSQPVKTFSVGFSGKHSKNELNYARLVAEHLGTEHHELMVTPDLVHQLPELIWHMDEPIGDPAALPTFFVSKLAKDCGVTVVLSGEGADEMFGGYAKYRQDYYLRLYQRLPDILRRIIPFLIDKWPRFERQHRLLLKMSTASNGYERAVAWRKVGFPDHYRKRLLNPEVAVEVNQQASLLLMHYLNSTEHLSDFQKMLQLDTMSWLPDDLLMKVDRMSMAASVEARVPYLDNSVVALAESMPDSLKIKGHKSKYVLKQIAQKILPAAIIQRPKQGFELPLDEWIRGDLASFFHDLVLDGYLQRTGLFNNSYIEALYKDQYDGRVDHGARIWMLANLRLWFERFSVGV